jgi:hypothetical protein
MAIPARSIRVARRAALAAVAAVVVSVPLLSAPGAISAVSLPKLPLNDLEAMLALTGTQIAKEKPVVTAPAPALVAVPRAHCGAGSHPLRGEQGRVPSTAVNSVAAASGWTCNLSVVAHHATPGGWRVWRYTDRHGHTCAYYDTSFAAPANLVSVVAGPGLGVVVLDMSNPAHPVRTATLTSLAMLSPHESLNLNVKRGLLAAEVGNALTTPGVFDMYSLGADCRHPALQAQMFVPTGHESGFSPDGRTFWAAGGAGYIYAIDVSDPKRPKTVWRGAYYSHGLSLSADGNTLYQTDPINGNIGLLDVSQIQARKPHPQVHDISRITWSTVSIPQNTQAFTNSGHHYLLEFDEFAFRFNPVTVDDLVGAARIIDIDEPAHPRITSNIRLAVNQQVAHRKAANDPSALPPGTVFGNAFHYCALESVHNPQLVACSAMNSGLRVFNISDPAHPREVAYFVAPPKAGHLLGLLPGDLATSQPSFDPEHHEIWYSDAGSGFYAVQLSASAWK